MFFLLSTRNIRNAAGLAALIMLLWNVCTPRPSTAQELWYDGFESSPHAAQQEESLSFSFDGQPSTGQSEIPLWGAATADEWQFDGSLSSTSSTWCLSCHDGVMASSVQNHDGTMSTPPSIGARPEENHPVGVAYDDSPKKHLHSVYSLVPGSDASVEDLLVDGRVECVSCHAVTREASIPDSALIRIEFRSARNWCTTCHAL